MANEIFPVTYYQTLKDVFWPLRLKRRGEWLINVQKIEKICKFCQKLQKFVMLKYLKHSTTTSNYAVNYYKTLEEAPWHLGLKIFRKWQKLSKILKKIVKICIKLRVFSDRLFLSSHGGGGWVAHRGAGWEGRGHQWVGQRGGGRWGQYWGGLQQWGCLQPLRTALHTISISLQNSASWNRAKRL